MKYAVHLYELVRVKVVDIEADSQIEAIGKAQDSYDPDTLFARGGPELQQHYPQIECIEWAEETQSYLVDEENDPEYLESRLYDADLKPAR